VIQHLAARVESVSRRLGQVVGAIGVSGVTSQQDGVCAQAAIEAFSKMCSV
jgi:uncharacterized protein GlcG (DUF336 family)